jgi:uncharacterized membrane protein YkvA (DUF1232 family)
MVTARRVAALRAFWDVVRGSSRSGAPGVGQRLRALPRMLAKGFTGRYPHLARGRIALAALALVYLVSPVDLIPELFVPILGLADDAVVAAWLVGVLLAEAETFLTWLRDRSRTVVGHVLAG